MTNDKTREDFEAWCIDYALSFEPNYSIRTKADCRAAFIAGTQQSAARIAALEAEVAAIAELNHAQWLALENVRHLAARNRKEEWAQHLLRFVDQAGTNKAQIMRKQVDSTALEAEVLALRERAVPSGCVVVPKEPTAEMLAAAAHISVCREDVYKAMIDAGQIITTPEGVAEWAQRLAIEAERGEG